MKKICLMASLMLTGILSFAQPATEIYLFDLSAKKGKVIISDPVNISNHKGYDNQPSFHPDQPIIYFATTDDSNRTDIHSYNYKKNTTVAVTQTTDKEYSPTVTPDKQFISCIIQREDGKQDLGKYPIEGGEPFLIINNMTVGYHVWADNSHLGLFILGTPATLHYLLLPMKKDTIIAENIGRALHRVPGENSISFVHKTSETEWKIKKMDIPTKKVKEITSTLPGSESQDLCWLPDGKILMSDGSKIFFYAPGSSWKEIEFASNTGVLKGVTRMAVSADGKKLAVVVAE